MKATIGNSLLPKLQAKNKPYDVRDDRLTGFLVRVNITGKMLYMCEYARGKRLSIGKVGVLTPTQARDRAKEILADAIKGLDPAGKKTTVPLIFAAYLEKEYHPWVEASRKSGKNTIYLLRTYFLSELGNKPLLEITPLIIEKWRAQRQNAGIKASTINRNMTALKAALSKAVEWGFIDQHPLAKLKPLKVDSTAKIRFLTEEEEINLRKAINMREEKLCLARDSGNKWRNERGYPELSDLRQESFVDYMKPMILVSMNTGLRRGELLSLTWDNVDLNRAILSIVGASAKSEKTRHLPLNSECIDVLKRWRVHTSGHEQVFFNKEGNPLGGVKRSWATILKLAEIKKFRWHDLRHHFASKLVMAGVDLNTVRELLGHSDIKMTLRYAHLSPEHKAEAVAKLVNPLFTKINA